MTESKPKPMPGWQSWTLFVGLGAVALALINLGSPWLVERFGLTSMSALTTVNIVLFGLLTALAIGGYLAEGRRLTWAGLKSRFRIRNISRRDWLFVGLGVLFVDGTYIGLQVAREPIAGLFPEWLKAPHRADSSVDYTGDYSALALFTGLILFNVISEELLWRGYVLPRQELRHGKRTWWIHGLQWTCFHWFKPWDLPAILPGALLYGWLSTRTKSMVPGLVLHIGLNGLGILMLALKVFG